MLNMFNKTATLKGEYLGSLENSPNNITKTELAADNNGIRLTSNISKDKKAIYECSWSEVEGFDYQSEPEGMVTINKSIYQAYRIVAIFYLKDRQQIRLKLGKRGYEKLNSATSPEAFAARKMSKFVKKQLKV